MKVDFCNSVINIDWNFKMLNVVKLELPELFQSYRKNREEILGHLVGDL